MMINKLRWLLLGLILFIVSGAVAFAGSSPNADFVFAPTNPNINEVVAFTSISIDSDNDISGFVWDLNGDNFPESVISKIVSFSVSSKTSWQDIGIAVNKGDIIKIKASGVINYDSDGSASSPNGKTSGNSFAMANPNWECSYLLCGENVVSHSLVGRIGSSSLTDYTNGFFSGSNFTMVADKSGKLYLGYNDGFVRVDRSGLDAGGVGDNSGSFDAVIEVKPVSISYSYSKSGEYPVTLSVIDSEGHINSKTKAIVVKSSVVESPVEQPVQKCTDSDGGNNIFQAGVIKVYRDGKYIDSSDYCISSNYVMESYCDGGNSVSRQMTCPEGYTCVNEDRVKGYGGACIKVDEDKGNPDLVIQNLEYNQQSSDSASIEFDVVNVGDGSTKDFFAIAVYIDGKIYTHTIYNEQNVGTRYGYDKDAVIPIKPGEKYHSSIGNYYWLANGQHTITIAADRFDRGDTNNNPIYDGFKDNMIYESREDNNKATIAVGSAVSEKKVYLGNSFNLQEGQSARVIDYKNMKIKLDDITVRCFESEGKNGGGCNPVYASIQVEMPSVCAVSSSSSANEACASTGIGFNLKEGEIRNVFGAEIELLNFESGHEASFIVRTEAEHDYVDVYIEPKLNTIKYGDYAKYEVTVVDKHPGVMCIPEKVCKQPIYNYQIEVNGLPFLKDYPEQITLAAGEKRSFTLSVQPYEIVEEKIAKQSSKDKRETVDVIVKKVEAKAITGRAVETTEEEKPIMISEPYYSREYKFSVRVMQSENPEIQDSAFSILRILPQEPKLPPPFPREQIEIKLYKGWNLINLPGKLVSFESDSNLAKKLLGFVYLKDEQRYVSINEAQSILGSGFSEYLATNAFWVYSYADYTLRINVDREISFDGIKLSPKWNLVPITEDMVGGYLSDIKGDCKFEKLHKWNAQLQRWEKLAEDYTFKGSEVNKGIILKAENYCTLSGVTISKITPPLMPE